MTFEDSDDTHQTSYQLDNKMQIGAAVRDCLLDAQSEGRIIYGLNASGEFLEMNADAVMCCILPEIVENDITLHIHFTLIEAFCWENEIRLIKVDSGVKLANLLSRETVDNNNAKTTGRRHGLDSSDVNCILIEYPKTHFSEADDDVLEFCKMTSNMCPQPIVDLAI